MVADFVPHIATKFGHRVGAILGRALLFTVCDVEARKFLPDNLYARLRTRYDAIKVSDDNPIEKKAVVIYAVGGRLMIDEVDNNENNEAARGTHDENQGTMKAMLAQNQALRIAVAELSVVLRQQHDFIKNELSRMKTTIRRFANRPAQSIGGIGGYFAPRRQGQQGQQENNDDNSNPSNDIIDDNFNIIPFTSTLCTKPRDLFQLWEEYEFGVGGRKAAKRFSTRERGRVKYKYHRRKVVWDKIKELIRRGHSHHTAIDEIYRIYGEQSTVTQIINTMRQD